MKYLLLLALTSTVIAAALTGCGNDLTHSHDIYRAQYNYKPLPQQDTDRPDPETLGQYSAAADVVSMPGGIGSV